MDKAVHRVRTTPQPEHAVNLSRLRKISPVPGWLDRLYEGDTTVGRTLDRALRSFHSACLAHQWSSVTDRFHHDIAGHTSTLVSHGLTAMLNSLSPGLRLTGLVLHGRYPWNRHERLDGRGLVLVPSAYWTGHPLFTWDPLDDSRHVLIYPAQPPHRAVRPGVGTRDALASLLGPTRADVMRVLLQPHTTGDIARRTGISTSSASEHAATLRGAGLITSNRQGQAVEHHLTHLGRTLLTGY